MIPVIDFGFRLFQAKDLDPVYEMLRDALRTRALPQEDLPSWLVAYWLFYSAEVACVCAEAPPEDFWRIVDALARTPGTPRGVERRHFRGQKSLDAISKLRKQYRNPAELIHYGILPTSIGDGRRVSSQAVITNVKKLPQFGPWIAWKVADMLDRVSIYSVCFKDANLAMYKDPVEGAVRACNSWGIKAESKQQAVQDAVEVLLAEYAKIPAPPKNDRMVNVQEIETVLCKWKSYRNGHYHIGKDTQDIYQSLTGKTRLGKHMKRFLLKMLDHNFSAGLY